MSPVRKRSPRSDATRNAARLVATAREVVAELGNDVAFDVVARRAGVGNATLYRHFPTRADLLIAVYADEVAALCQHGEQMLESAEPVDALFAWLDAFVVHVSTKRALALAATGGAERTDERRTALFRQWHASITSTAERLVRRAQPALRRNLTATDVLALASGAALTTGTEHARHLVTLLRTGIVNRTGTPGN